MNPPRDLSVEQCRTLARLRRLRPDLDVRLHETRHGLVVEARRGKRSEVAYLDPEGTLRRERPLEPDRSSERRRSSPSSGATPAPRAA